MKVTIITKIKINKKKLPSYLVAKEFFDFKINDFSNN
jgi:hypothetical protein